jgi:outer membrane protein OmpA-like peptidoglycan-associated protein
VKSLVIICFISVFTINNLYSQKLINAVALENGATMLVIPPSETEITEREVLTKYSAGSLFDQSPKPWSSSYPKFPLTFIIELAEEYNIQQLVFDNRCEFYPGIDTKTVRVEFSTESKDSGFQVVGEYELNEEVLNEISISPKKTRWIKLIILSNYGLTKRVQMAEFKAMGVPGNRMNQTVDISGVWHTNWQDMTIEQKGKTFSGNYVYTSDGRKYKGKVVNGSIERNAISFTWDEKNARGNAKLYLNQEGNQISGFWHNGHIATDFNLWTMHRTKEESKPIEYSEPIEPEVIPEEVVEEVVEANENPIKEEPIIEPTPPIVTTDPVINPAPIVEKTVVQGPPKIGNKELTEIKAGEAITMESIIFALGTAKVQKESFAELDILFDYLQDNKEAKVKINGHTDMIGDPDKNIMLSQARANAVRTYLTKKGVAKNRIKAVGMGDTQTLCPSPCEQNRRVDFVLLE